MKKYGRRDNNSSELVRELRRHGFEWLDLGDLGGGVPDGVAARRNVTTGVIEVFFCEIKNLQSRYGRKGANEDQIRWAGKWPTPVYLLQNLQDVGKMSTGLQGELSTIQTFGGNKIEDATGNGRGRRAASLLPDGAPVEHLARTDPPGRHGRRRSAR